MAIADLLRTTWKPSAELRQSLLDAMWWGRLPSVLKPPQPRSTRAMGRMVGRCLAAANESFREFC